jgi:predicted metal-binding membrane protein
MAMAWMRMPGETWLAAATSFLGMWLLMMAAMMLPSLAPVLWRYRQAITVPSAARSAGLTALVGSGYFLVWTAIGFAVFTVGVALMALEVRLPALARAAPTAAGAIVVLAGALQFTTWKAHHLACFQEVPGQRCPVPPHSVAAWRYGLRLGLHCSYSCAGFTAVFLVIGMMDLRVMAAVTTAITAERRVPAGTRAARAIGAVAVAAGLFLIARSVGM